MYIIGRVFVDKPFLIDEFVTLTSASEASSEPSSEWEQGSVTASKMFSGAEKNRGILRIGSNMKADREVAVFEMSNYYIIFEHIDIEYPDAVEGDALDIINAEYDLEITDVVFRPWYTCLKGENVKGGEGRALPYKLIVLRKTTETFKQLVIYGRNGNITSSKQHNECENAKEGEEERSVLRLEEPFASRDEMNEAREEENPSCLWDCGLLYLYEAFHISINDSSFVGISDGAIYSTYSRLTLNNCSFENNHPIGKDWEKFHSLRNNIRFQNEQEEKPLFINSLASGSDGLEERPFGMLVEGGVGGHAAQGMDSYFFTPILTNATMIIKAKGMAEKGKGQIIESDEGTQAVIRGSYLFPCKLTVEA
ncbi:uncharacterized protein MONOS_4946 [Monocercomonoides exilis]|uniref:uncharacterized protein n=1 Tax=Monocercomonoides exilis TaxID=2049356 RepID=UPI003559C29A|nr:hypothetical protein MONOS_4946 [Monocercomonoides exilis]|eukprot:MONOS_4946.1-p1 / transcript=MONOS_4946.1 / gene=MONOS_4946 / organism=Monocercomonoides_exilis_PA203 / gene_product=unspecified product / transcript_product=unspecified product / location=Mono_scaffold00138:90626-91723(+) / protein_length=366 / sequence_SO=supercontig / SO=protein_coding / is_pseudo=false